VIFKNPGAGSTFDPLQESNLNQTANDYQNFIFQKAKTVNQSVNQVRENYLYKIKKRHVRRSVSSNQNLKNLQVASTGLQKALFLLTDLYFTFREMLTGIAFQKIICMFGLNRI
jgi:hypothetical protein